MRDQSEVQLLPLLLGDRVGMLEVRIARCYWFVGCWCFVVVVIVAVVLVVVFVFLVCCCSWSWWW